MKKIYFLSLILLPLFGNAQYTLKGIVKDKSTDQPLAGVTLSIPTTNTATGSNSQGEFTLSSATNFDSITVNSVGYTTLELAAIDKSRGLVILLETSSTALHTLEVSDFRRAESTATLTQADLNRFSGLSLQDELNTVPGVDMQSRSPWGGQHIIIRGYYPSADNGKTDGENFNGLGYQLTIDNIPVTDATGTTIMDDIDFSTLGKVEVIKGPDPLYGSFTAGAVNLFTPMPDPGQTSIKEELIGGSYGLFRTNTTFQTSNGNTDLWVNYGHQTYDGFRPHDASQKDFASAAGHLYQSAKQSVSYYFSYNHSYEDLAGEIDSADFYGRKAVSDSNYTNNNSHVEIESFRTGIIDQYQFNGHFSNQTTLFATGSTLNQYFAHGFDKDESLNFGGRTAFYYTAKGDHITTDGVLGAFFQRSDQGAQGNFILPFILPPFTSSSPFDFPSDVQNYAMNYNVYTQWHFSFPSGYTLTAGGSLNFNEFGTQNLLTSSNAIYLNNPIYIRSFAPVFTPGASLLKTINSQVSVYASVNMGYAPPTISQMTTSTGNVDTQLKPESAFQYEIGTKGNLGKDQKFSYQLALFDMDITNRLIEESANALSFYTNAGEERNLGAELSASYNVVNDKTTPLSLVRPWITYTYSDFTYVNFKNYGESFTGGDTLLADYSGHKVAAVAPNVLNLGLDLRLKSGFYFNSTYRYVDKVPVTFDNSTYMKSYGLLSAKIGYQQVLNQHFEVDLYMGADNLLNSSYYSFIFVGQNIQELAQGNDPNIPNGGGDGYILPAPYKATMYGGAAIKYTP